MSHVRREAGLGPGRDEPLAVAVVGLGWWGRAIVCALEGNPKLRVVATAAAGYSGAEFARTHGVSFTTNLDAVLNAADIQAVILCTPHSLHGEQIARAARARKHVFCEKPLALTRDEALASLAVCDANNVVLGVGHEHRFKPAVVALKDAVSAGELGTIMRSEATFTSDSLANLTPGHWRRSADEAPCGPLTATAIHGLDLCVSMQGAPVSVLANLRDVVADGAADALGIFMEFKDGSDAVVSALNGPPFSCRFAVFGTDGWVEIRDKAHPQAPKGWIVTTCRRGGAMETVEWPPALPVVAGLEAFADAAAGRTPYPVPRQEMIATVSAMEAVVQSVAGGQSVQVKD